MCRLLASRSAKPAPLYRGLLSGDNSFSFQSLEHPDGWGVAYYVAGAPHLVKGTLPAISDEVFERVSLWLESTTTLAHVRRATTGKISVPNCHPFQFGPWVFAHNGFIRNFSANREKLLERVSPSLRSFVLGETDSEVMFVLLLSRLSERIDLADRDPDWRVLAATMAETIEHIRDVSDHGEALRPEPADESLLTSILTNGPIMMGTCSGKPLAYRVGQNAETRTVTLSSELIGSEVSGLEDGVRELKRDEFVVVDAATEVHAGAF